uniref:ZP domain-containing protein n=1 Tax=Meloidogyne hapla TaxID=6305 RepID=A0A1I8B3F8_MELHA
MASISYFLLFGALLLLIGCVQCEFVGHGKHELVNGTIVQLNTNTRIAENDTDLVPYREMDGACNVKMDKEGNMLSFAFSLKDAEFKELKRGPKKGNDSKCNEDELRKCKNKRGECWDTTAFYSFGWIQMEENDPYVYLLLTVGDIVNAEYNESDQASLVLIMKGESFRTSNTNFNLSNVHCHKKENIRKHQEWEIKDENFNNNTNNENFTNLFTFHIMPVEAMRSSIQKMLVKCTNDSNNEYCKPNETMLKCDKMFIRFDKEHFKILVPDPAATENGISTNGRNENLESSTAKNVDKTDNMDTNEVDTTQDIRLTKDPKTTEEDSGMFTLTIVLIICGILVLILASIVGVLIWILFRGDKEENKQLEPEPNQGSDLRSTQSTTIDSTSNKDSTVDVELSPANIGEKEGRFNDSSTVVETQYNQDFNEVDTVVETQIDPNEPSNLKTGVKVPDTVVNDFTTKSDRTVPETLISTNTVHEDPAVPDTKTGIEGTDVPDAKTGIEGTDVANTKTGVEVPDSVEEE